MFLKIAIISLALIAVYGDEVCQSTIHPVCASNGKEYLNNCKFLKARKELIDATSERIQILKLGTCSTNDAVVDITNCASRNQPVCASNGITYRNTCYFRRNRKAIFEYTGEKIKILKTGDCLSTITRNAEEESILAKLNSEPL